MTATAPTAADCASGEINPEMFIDQAHEFRRSQPVNAMTVDVEEHFQVSAFESRIERDEWRNHESRVRRNVDRIMGIFDDAGVKATFFTLGCVAERVPDLIRRIADEGHELASHGYDHKRVTSLTAEEFLADISRTKDLLEQIGGTQVLGYRAPSFSIGAKTPWAHDLLQEAGHSYSSSIYPIKHDHYGFPSAPRFPFRHRPGGLLELPLTTAIAGGRNLPGAGGGYFRLLPTAYSHWAINFVNKEQMPALFYFHPWEIDPDQPRVAGIPATTRFRHYVNLGRFERRLKKVLAAFSWGRVDRLLPSTS